MLTGYGLPVITEALTGYGLRVITETLTGYGLRIITETLTGYGLRVITETLTGYGLRLITWDKVVYENNNEVCRKAVCIKSVHFHDVCHVINRQIKVAKFVKKTPRFSRRPIGDSEVAAITGHVHNIFT